MTSQNAVRATFVVEMRRAEGTRRAKQERGE
jgi:hypothetical protein